MLPKEAAEVLHQQNQATQAITCGRVRQFIVALESLGVVLDPVTFEAVITILVAQEVATSKQIEALCKTINYLKDRDGST